MKKLRLAGLVLAAFVLTAPCAGAATVTWVTLGASTNDWFDTNNWSSAAVPANGDEVIINYTNVGVRLTNATAELSSLLISNKANLIFSNWDTKLSATNVTIATNATMTLPSAFTNNAMSNRVWLACSNLTVAAGGSINVDGNGYAKGTPTRNGQGPGGGTTGGNGGGGGGHGGYGGNGYNGGRGSPYDSTNAPLWPGSGGGGDSGYSSSGANGGGAVLIEANGVVTVNGTITANGNSDGTIGRGGGGSGGSIYISCDTFTGTNGTVRAAGGMASTPANPTGGSGAGGRIAIVFNPAAQSALAAPTVTFSTQRGTNSYGADAQIGTLYFPSNSLLNPAWMPHSGLTYIPDFTAWSVDTFTVTNGWFDFPAAPALQLTVTNAMTLSGATTRFGPRNGVITCGSLTLTSGAALYLGSSSTKTNPQSISCGGNLALAANATLGIYAAETNVVQTNLGALVSVTGDVSIANGASLLPYSAYTNGASPLWRMRNLTIASGGAINADSKGFAGSLANNTAGYGPGKGAAKGDNSSGGGGGYGGRGGNGNGVSGGVTYGSSNAPVQPGSGGGTGLGTGGYGGGLVRIEVQESMTMDGTISANGSDGTYQRGAGSGGGIYLRSRIFTGGTGGVLRANGGDDGGGGGGGRIAVWSIYRTFSGSAAVTNGTGGDYTGSTGAPGTIVWGQLPAPGAVVSFK